MSFHFQRLDFCYIHSLKVLAATLFVTLIIIFAFPKNALALHHDIILLTPPTPVEFYYEVAQEIFKISGTTVKTHVESYPNISKKMASTVRGSKEIYATVYVLNDDITKQYHNVANILSIETSFYTLKTSKKRSKTIDEVKNLDKICVWLNSTLNKYLINQGFDNLIPAPTFNECIAKLFNGKVDAIFSTEAPLIKASKINGHDLLKLKKGFTPMRVTFFLAITKNASKDFIKKISNSGDQLRSSGKYDELLNKYRRDLFLPQ